MAQSINSSLAAWALQGVKFHCKASQEHRDRGCFSLGWRLTTVLVPPAVTSLNQPASALICGMWDAESSGVVQPGEGMVKGVPLLPAAAL